MRDFNVDLINVQNANDFLNNIYANCLYPLITKPTRVSPTSSSLIDIIFTNVTNENIQNGIRFTDLTDHFPIFCKSCNDTRDAKENVKFRNYSQVNINSFYHKVACVDWDPVLLDGNANSS